MNPTGITNDFPGPGRRTESLQAAWSGVRDEWLAGKNNRLVPFVDQKMHSLARSLDTDGFTRLIALIDELNGVAADAALSVVSRLEYLLERVDVDGLGRWILTGLRLYPTDPAPQERFFSLTDSAAVGALNIEASEQNASDFFPALGFYLTGLSDRKFAIQARHQTVLNGPPARPVIAPGALLLPDSYTMLDGPDRSRLYWAAVAHIVAHLKYSPARQPVATLKPLGIAVVSTVEDARVERLLVRDYPGLRNLFLSFLRAATQQRSLSFESLAVRLHHAILDPGYEDDSYWVNKGRRLFEEQAFQLENYKAFREISSILANDLGQMRLGFNARLYAVSPAYCDDNSYLWDAASDASPPPETEVQLQGARLEKADDQQGQDRPQDAPRDGEGAMAVALQTSGETRYCYNEWDYRISADREDWCTVVERPGAVLAAASGRSDPLGTMVQGAAAPRLARRSQLSRRHRLRRQWEGEEIDLNAAIDVFIDRRNGMASDSRVFLKPGRQERSMSILVLMDLSESSNDRIPGRFDSILDMEKKASLMLANAVAQTSNRLAIHGFSSNTRQEVHYYRFVEFGEALDAQRVRTLNNASAAFSTRMGAALRHASSLLGAEENERKLVILVTDGAPSDIDVFDPEYLIQDARVSVGEAGKGGVDCFCLTLDAHAEAYVQRIFGMKNYRIVDDPLSLPSQLSLVFSQIASIR
jgi:nitric oxide reductase NorD protein